MVVHVVMRIHKNPGKDHFKIERNKRCGKKIELAVMRWISLAKKTVSFLLHKAVKTVDERFVFLKFLRLLPQCDFMPCRGKHHVHKKNKKIACTLQTFWREDFITINFERLPRKQFFVNNGIQVEYKVIFVFIHPFWTNSDDFFCRIPVILRTKLQDSISEKIFIVTAIDNSRVFQV